MSSSSITSITSLVDAYLISVTIQSFIFFIFFIFYREPHFSLIPFLKILRSEGAHAQENEGNSPSPTFTDTYAIVRLIL